MMFAETVIRSVAAAAPGDGTPLTYLTGLGFPGIIIVMLVTGMLTPKWVVDKLIRDNDKKDSLIEAGTNAYNELQTSIAERVVPALQDAKSLAVTNQQLQMEISMLRSQLDGARRGE